MAHYYNDVLAPMLQQVKRSQIESDQDKKLMQRASTLLKREQTLLSPKATSHLQALLERYEPLRIAYDYRQSLQFVWLKTASSQKELIESLQAWCKQAEESGLELLKQFAAQLKSYVPRIPEL
jgi:stearoyl-CoA desaturase (delta-9 desaturase)